MDRNLSLLPIRELAIGGFGFSGWLNLKVIAVRAWPLGGAQLPPVASWDLQRGA